MYTILTHDLKMFLNTAIRNKAVKKKTVEKKDFPLIILHCASCFAPINIPHVDPNEIYFVLFDTRENNIISI